MPNELLTIAIPVYERLDYFREALESALNQTVPVRVIVVDNASSHDGFRQIIDSYGDPRISYIRNPRNLGMYGNWNRCAECVTTPYFMILGDDDIVAPEYVESFLTAYRQHPDIAAYFSQLERFGDAHDGNDKIYDTPRGYVHGMELLRSATTSGLNIPTNAMVLAKSLFAKDRFLYPEYALNQDWLFAYTALADKWCFSESRPLLRCRIHGSGNSLTVGSRAVLSTALVYHAIHAGLLAAGQSTAAARAAWRERWTLRNSVVRGETRLVQDMINDTASPFGRHLSKLAQADGMLRMAMRDGSCGKLGVLLLRSQRFLCRHPSIRDLFAVMQAPKSRADIAL